MKHLFYTATALVLLNSLAFGQKKTEHNTYSWVSINSNIYVHKHWFIMADAHVRENGFFASSSFVFARLGLGHQADSKLSLAAGYGNLLLSPSTPGWKTKADEHRIYQQVQLSSEYKKIKLLQRLRNEQRWQQIITNDQKTGNTKFSNRVRYLLSATVPLFKNKKWPQLVIADEMLLQF